jgi:hypothetical protein
MVASRPKVSFDKMAATVVPETMETLLSNMLTFYQNASAATILLLTAMLLMYNPESRSERMACTLSLIKLLHKVMRCKLVILFNHDWSTAELLLSHYLHMNISIMGHISIFQCRFCSIHFHGSN